MGTLPGRVGLYIVLAATLLGVLGTVLIGSEPGFLLGFTILIGSVAAALGVRRRALYLVFPLPALANFIGAVMAGAIHDRGIDTSTTELGASFLQWIANVFFAMCATTIVVLMIAGGRWLLARQLVSGQFPMSADRRPGDGPRTPPAGGRPGRDQRPGGDRDPWAAVSPWDDPSGPGGPRANRDQRDVRDPWGDRRRPAGPGQSGTGPQSGGGTLSGGRGQPGGGTPPPGGRGQPGGTYPPGARNPSGNRGLPPDRRTRGPRDPWDDQDPRATRSRHPSGDRRNSRDPWARGD